MVGDAAHTESGEVEERHWVDRWVAVVLAVGSQSWPQNAVAVVVVVVVVVGAVVAVAFAVDAVAVVGGGADKIVVEPKIEFATAEGIAHG